MIVATGATARQLGLPSEQALQGKGVTYCAVCDAAFYRDKEVIVVGGGDSAMEEAIFLTKFATKVTIVHRREEFRASSIMLDRARANEKIEFVTNAVVDEVLGDEKMTGVRLRDTQTDETSELPADGLFVAIGHDPNTKLFLDWLDHDDARLPVTKPRLDRDEHPGRLRRRRRAGPRLPPGGHRRGLGQHGRARRRALPRRAGRPPDGRRVGAEKLAVRARLPSARGRMDRPARSGACSARSRPCPTDIHDDAIERLLAPLVHDDEPRPEARRTEDVRLRRSRDAVVLPEPRRGLLPGGRLRGDARARRHRAKDDAALPAVRSRTCPRARRAGLIVAALADRSPRRSSTAVDALDDEVDALDDDVESGDPAALRRRIRSLRHHLLRVRRVDRPDARGVPSRRRQRVDVEGDELFPHEVEIAFGDAYDKLLRAVDGLDLARDLLAGSATTSRRRSRTTRTR